MQLTHVEGGEYEPSPKELNNNNTSAENAIEAAKFQPPDGGLHAWLIVIASFLINGLIFSLHNCYGILYGWMKASLEENGVQDAASKCSLIGSLSLGMTFFLSPVSSVLVDRIGLRKTAVMGGFLATVGMLSTSFSLKHVNALYLSYGILFGGGASLVYNPSLIILGHYFQKKLGFVNGVVTAGSSTFTIVLPYALDAMLRCVGLAATLQVLGGVMMLLMVCAMSFTVQRSNEPSETIVVALPEPPQNWRQNWSTYINVSIWRNKRYILWAIAVPFSLFGYFVPYVHLVAYAKDIVPEADGKLLVLCIGVTSGLGRLIFGKLSDLPQINRVVLQQVSLLCIGVLTMLLTLAESMTWLTILCLGMGLFDGCFVSLVGPVAFDLCGPSGVSQALGFLLGLYAIPVITGPPVAGLLYDSRGSYQVAFLLAGCAPIIGAFIMCFIGRKNNDDDPSLNANGPCIAEVTVRSGIEASFR